MIETMLTTLGMLERLLWIAAAIYPILLGLVRYAAEPSVKFSAAQYRKRPSVQLRKAA